MGQCDAVGTQSPLPSFNLRHFEHIEQESTVQLIRKTFLALATVTALLGSASCVALVPHEANTNLVQDSGVEAVTQRMTTLLKSAQAPVFSNVEVDQEMMRLQLANYGAWGWGWGYGGNPMQGVSIPYRAITKVDLYENNKVFLYMANGGSTIEILFPDMGYATEFVDHVASMQRFAAENG